MKELSLSIWTVNLMYVSNPAKNWHATETVWVLASSADRAILCARERFGPTTQIWAVNHASRHGKAVLLDEGEAST